MKRGKKGNLSKEKIQEEKTDSKVRAKRGNEGN